MNATRTLVVWCRDWPVVALEQPLGEPVAVLSANRVVGTSPAARVAGITDGLRRREAQRRCPEVRVVERDVDREARAFGRILATLDAITPRVEIHAPGRCAFPTRGPSRYFGGDEAVAARVRDLVGRLLAERDGCGVGVADGAFAATLAAQRSLARAGSPPVVVAPGRSAEFVAPLPVTSLASPGPIAAEVIDVIVRLGLRRLGEVAAIPRADLLARFGNDGALAHRLASGDDDRPAHLVAPPADLDQTVELDPPAERVDQVAFVAKSLADRLVAALGSRGLACTRLVVVIEVADGDVPAVIERSWRDGGVLGAAAMTQRVRWQLDGWLSRPGRSRRVTVQRIRLHPDQVVAAGSRQPGFWGGVTAADEAATRAAARIVALAGAEVVLVPEHRGGRGAHEQIRLLPIDSAGSAAAAAGSGGAPWPGRVPRPAPASVWPDPLPAELADACGATVEVSGRGELSAAPSRLSIDGGPWAQVAGWAGPWLVDERWWDPVGHRRRARFQVQMAGEGAHLLALEGGTWWVEATYD